MCAFLQTSVNPLQDALEPAVTVKRRHSFPMAAQSAVKTSTHPQIKGLVAFRRTI